MRVHASIFHSFHPAVMMVALYYIRNFDNTIHTQKKLKGVHCYPQYAHSDMHAHRHKRNSMQNITTLWVSNTFHTLSQLNMRYIHDICIKHLHSQRTKNSYTNTHAHAQIWSLGIRRYKMR